MKPDWSDVAIITLIGVVVFGAAISCAIHRGLQPYNESNKEIATSLVKIQSETIKQRVLLQGLRESSLSTNKVLLNLFEEISVSRKILIQKVEVRVQISFYEPHPDQTDATPLINASNQRVKIGTCALSRPFEKDYGLEFGDALLVEGLGLFHFQDRMNKRFKDYRIDIFVWKHALQKGIKFSENVYIIKGL